LKIKKYFHIFSSVNLAKKPSSSLYATKDINITKGYILCKNLALKLRVFITRQKPGKIKKKKMNLAKKPRKTKKTADSNCGQFFAQSQFFY